MVNHQITGDRGTRPSPLSPDDLVALRELVAGPSRASEPAERRSAARKEVRAQPAAASARTVPAGAEAALGRPTAGRCGRCHPCRHAVDRERPAIVPRARCRTRCRQVREAGR
ncbi:Zinc finger DksA/TraR C4-type domain-containing protein OS=Streptomyces tendae OX=1932 GN=GUR47_31140 PE=4 SV=1 [Streptomyces tendae]